MEITDILVELGRISCGEIKNDDRLLKLSHEIDRLIHEYYRNNC